MTVGELSTPGRTLRSQRLSPLSTSLLVPLAKISSFGRPSPVFLKSHFKIVFESILNQFEVVLIVELQTDVRK